MILSFAKMNNVRYENSINNPISIVIVSAIAVGIHNGDNIHMISHSMMLNIRHITNIIVIAMLHQDIRGMFIFELLIFLFF